MKLLQFAALIAVVSGATNKWIGATDGSGSFTGGLGGSSCPSTWSLGSCPTGGEDVLIDGSTVTFDDERDVDHHKYSEGDNMFLVGDAFLTIEDGVFRLGGEEAPASELSGTFHFTGLSTKYSFGTSFTDLWKKSFASSVGISYSSLSKVVFTESVSVSSGALSSGASAASSALAAGKSLRACASAAGAAASDFIIKSGGSAYDAAAAAARASHMFMTKSGASKSACAAAAGAVASASIIKTGGSSTSAAAAAGRFAAGCVRRSGGSASAAASAAAAAASASITASGGSASAAAKAAALASSKAGTHSFSVSYSITLYETGDITTVLPKISKLTGGDFSACGKDFKDADIKYEEDEIKCVGCKSTSYPTPSPTLAPTPTPTSAPTKAPTVHPCRDGSHGCDKSPAGICYPAADGSNGWSCDCINTHWCSEGCSQPHISHTCVLITKAPTPYPTPYPTSQPTTFPTPYPTAYPTSQPTTYPTPYPTAYPTSQPTTYPTPYPTAYPTSMPTPAPTPAPTTAPTMKMCKFVTCAFKTDVAEDHPHFLKMDVTHHKLEQDLGQNHKENRELVGKHSCGASNEWMVNHDFHKYGWGDDLPVHNKDGKVWHKDAVKHKTAPECSCECEYTSMAPKHKFKEFLKNYETILRSEASAGKIGKVGSVDRKGTMTKH